MEKTIETFGKIDVLVNNADIVRPALLHKMSEEDRVKVINVDLTGTFNCIQAVPPYDETSLW